MGRPYYLGIEERLNMKEILVTGHRNPDADSICAAYAYADLKNRIDPENRYIPIRCGQLSEQLKKQFSFIGFEPQQYRKDVFARVRDVMLKPENRLDADTPIYNLVKIYGESQPSAVPVFDKEEYLGLLSLDDITSWLLKDNKEDVPEYDLSVTNIASVIPGWFLENGKTEQFRAFTIAGAAAFEEFRDFVTPGKNCVVVMGFRREYIEHAARMQVPGIIITATREADGLDLTGYNGFVYVTHLGTAEVLRRLRLSPAVRMMLGKQGSPLSTDDLFDDAKQMLASSSLRGLSVYDNGKWAGYVTRRCFLTKPSFNVILVDHNESAQSIAGLDEATVCEIIDHHRLDAPKTISPIFIDAEPLGSTCTIVYKLFRSNGLAPSEAVAKVLLTGILCDTLVLKSPTTTPVDISFAKELAELCGITDVEEFGTRLFSFSLSLAEQDPETVIRNDFKEYRDHGIRIGIGQCEVNSLSDLDEYKEQYLDSLVKVRNSLALDWAMLMVTDVFKGNSILLCTPSKFEKRLSFESISEHVYDMPGVLSRKKQLLIEIISAMNQ